MKKFISYTYEEHIIHAQNKAEAAFLAKFEEEKPNLEDAHVIVNPYLINPLAALILFKTDVACAPTLTIHGKNHAREDIVHNFPKGTSHALPVVGLYEDRANLVSVKLDNGLEKTFTVKTGSLPADICRCRNVMTSLDYFGTDFMFLTPAGKNLPTAYDYQGNIRWLLTVNTMFDIKRLKNGHIMTGSHRYSRMPYNGVGLVELNLLGKIYNEFRMPGNYHHDHWEMEDGNILALTQDFHTSTVEDMIALLDRKSGQVLRTWDFKEFLPQDVGGSGSQDAHDWFHNNALWYDKKTNSITLSGRHQDAVVNINYETNTLNWIIGDPEGWPEDMQKYFFKPVGDVANFDWQYEQHACVVCPDGDIMCFDNGQYRAKVKEKYIKNRDNFSRGVRYRIDTDKMEIEQIWQYGKERGQEFFSPYICNVEYYDEGHYLIHSGGIGWKNGYASDALGAFLNPAANADEELCSKTVEEKNGVVLFDMEVSGNFYRAERLSPYHDGDNAPFGEGKILGELDVTPTFDTIPDVEEVMEIIPLERELSISEEVDKFVVQGLYERGSMVMIVLEGKEKHGYFINTAASWHLAMCSGAFLEEDERVVKTNISKLGLSGKYDIKIIINDKKYQTGISIFC